MTVERVLTTATQRPAPYVRLYSFTDWEANHPTDPAPGTQLDAEFNAVQISLTSTQSRLAQIQRDDGALANGSVYIDQIDPALFATLQGGWNPRGAWQANSAYAVGDAVNYQGVMWVGVKAHTSTGNFAADLQAGDWMPVMQPIAAQSIPVTPLPGIPAVNVQGALEGLAAQITALTARVVALENAP